MAGKLAGRVAIITGAGGGIGNACARRLAAEGAIVVAADIVAERAAHTVEAITNDGFWAVSQTVDISDEQSVHRLYAEVLRQFGRVDIVHNNATNAIGDKIMLDAAIEEMNVDLWDRAFAVNTRGTMLMIKHALKPMLAAGRGSIINMSSGAALAGDFYAPAYASSKAAMNTLTLYVATQYGKRNIRCNVISPGLIVTPAAEAHNQAGQLRVYEDNSLLPELGRPGEIAAMLLFLASDESAFITGQILRVDGGYTAHMPHTAPLRSDFERSPSRRP